MRMRFALTIAIVLAATPAWATKYYHVRAAPAGSQNGTSWADAWEIDTIDWSTIHGELANEDVVLYFKRGDVFEKDRSYVLRVLHSGGTWLSHTGPHRLSLTTDPADTGHKPRFQVPAGRIAYSLIAHGDYAAWQNHELGHVTFENLDIRWPYNTADYVIQKGVTGIGIQNAGSEVHVIGCEIYGCGHYSVALGHPGDRCVVVDNRFEDGGNGVYFMEEGSEPGGGYHYVANNTCKGLNGDLRFDVDGSIRDGHCVALQSNSWSIIEGNTSEDARNDFVIWVKGPSGCLTCAGQYNVFRNNVARRSLVVSYNVGGDSTDPNPDMNLNLFYGNVSDDSAAGLRQSHAFAAPGNKWFHNTFSRARPESGTGDGAVRIRRLADNHSFMNNIIDVAGVDDLLISMTSGGGQMVGTHNSFDGNLYGENNASGWRFRDGTEGDFAFWQGKNTVLNDPHSPLPADARLLDPDQLDFTLAVDSPAIDNGVFLTFVMGPAGTGTTFVVDDPTWLHDDRGMSAHGARGTELGLFDDVNGQQNTMVTAVDYATGDVTVDTPVSWQGGDATKVALRFTGTAPDIGAMEFGAVAGAGGSAGGSGGMGGASGAGGSGGTGGSAGMAGAAGSAGQGGASSTPSPAEDEAGCGCRQVGSVPRGAVVTLATVVTHSVAWLTNVLHRGCPPSTGGS